MTEAEIDQMQDEIADLKSDLALAKLENQRLKEANKELEDRYADFRRERDQFKRIADTSKQSEIVSERKRDELEGRISALKGEIAKNDERFNDMYRDLSKQLELAEQKLEMKEREVSLLDQDGEMQASRERAITAALNAAKERISVLEAALVGVRLIVEGVSHARQATPGA